ncbi:MAG TPA: right-handed parallel beta-helix repeat-containing protein [Methylophilaceae bacterium]|nr:right-handed parallel beta-helix repeat-containing protein [Methylophilaceae bacterium]
MFRPNVWQFLLVLFLLVSLWLQPAVAADRFVAPDQGGAEDAGPGSNEKPYKTITYAMSQLQPGDKLIIAAGTYRDAIIFPERDWAAADNTIVEGKGQVLIKGSDVVKDWQPINGGSGLPGRYVKSWQTEPQQVFVNGEPLIQIGGTVFGGFPEKADHPLQALHKTQKGIWPGRRNGGLDNMPPNSFYYDRLTLNLFIQLANPEPKNPTIEVSARPVLLSGNGLEKITVRNLNFQHSNTSTNLRSGLVTLVGNKLTLENIRVTQADSTGIDLAGDDITLKNSAANGCGQIGLKARGARMKLINNETSNNNTRGFNKWWEAGGAKFIGLGGLQDSTMSGHRAFSNNGDGVWYDWKNRNNTIEKSFFAYNKGMGLHYEASDQAVISSNISIGNEQRGIYLPHSSDSVIAHNLVAGNKEQGIAIVDEGRRDQENAFDFSARRNRVFGNVLAWNGGSLVLPTEIDDNRSDNNIYIGDPAQANPGLGWVRFFTEPLDRWTGRTQQDKNSLRMESSIDEGFAKTIANRSPEPDLNWYQALRSKTKPLPVNPEWLKRVPNITDFRPGPPI